MAQTTDTKKILVIPDTQVREGVPVNHLKWISNFIVAKKPDIVVHLGDHWDMPSLSSYDVGKKSFEGRRYTKDIEAGNNGMALLSSSIDLHNARARKYKEKQYLPEKYYCTGNHDQRIQRAVEDDPRLDGAIGMNDRDLTGWKEIPFLEPLILEDIAFCHYFTTGIAGRPASTAAAQLRKTNMSSIAGHQQGKQIAYATKANGSTITSIIAGSCYMHSEAYLGAQGNKHWHGVIMLHEVKDGSFDESFISLKFLESRYNY